MDDLSDEIKQPVVPALLKKNRHYKSKVIISTQYAKDLLPACYKQLDIIILMKDLPDDNLEHIHSQTAMSISLNLFIARYNHATEGSHNSLWIDSTSRNFVNALPMRTCESDPSNYGWKHFSCEAYATQTNHCIR